MNQILTKDIIFDYFDGRATLAQKRQIDEWIKLDNNEELFYKYLDEWEQTHLQFQSDTDIAIKNYYSFIEAVNNPEIHEPQLINTRDSERNKSLFWFITAAIFLLFCSVSGDTILYQRYVTKPGEIASWILEDGSKVTLNANSAIKYRKNWLNQSHRMVYLRGEAEFDVSHKKDNRKFIVKTNNHIDIIVLGTVFTVFNRNAHTEVVLNEGHIELKHETGNSGKTVSMLPGDKVILNKSGQLKKGTVSENEIFAGWKEHRFVFDNTPLSEVIRLLSENYHLEGVIKDSELASQTISGSFRAETYRDLISSVSEILDIKYEIKNNKQVIFSKR